MIAARENTGTRPDRPWRLPRRPVVVAFAFLSTILVPIRLAQGQRAAPTEYQVKAAYLYNFGKFVAWPESADASKNQSFEICVLGEDPFGKALDTTVAGEKIGGKGIATKRIVSAREIDDCRILFISSSEGERLADILGAIDKLSVLTVSDLPQFSERGGMIEFVQDGSRVRFEVNLSNAEYAGLNLSSELLKVAVRVARNPHSGN